MSRVPNPRTPAEALAIMRALLGYPRHYAVRPPMTTEQIDHAMSLEQRAEAMAEGESVGWREENYRADAYFADRHFVERGAW